jgi:lipid II:glycine glycyltransferase (peptidoglycan interpeptide bridge formation enzyme)
MRHFLGHIRRLKESIVSRGVRHDCLSSKIVSDLLCPVRPSRNEILNDKLSATDGFEMADSFGIKTKKETREADYKFPMQIPYIAKMQDKNKSLIKEVKKIDHKYELTQIERTAVLRLN